MTRYTEEKLAKELWDLNYKIWQIDEIVLLLDEINEYCDTDEDLSIDDYLEDNNLKITNRGFD